MVENKAVTPGRPVIPRWLWALLLVGIAVGLTVRHRLDHAFGHVIIGATIIVCLLNGLVRYARFTAGSMVRRCFPLVAFCFTLILIGWAVRIDSMSGNLIPTRVSFRWQPPPDERIGQLEIDPETPEIDLSTTTPDDFPQFLGPHRDGSVDRVELAEGWDSSPPQLLWRKETFGAGWSAFSVVNGYAVTMEQRGDEEQVTCYEVSTGKPVWVHTIQARHETVPGGVGPRSTPTVDDGRVFALGATGVLRALEGGTGKELWQVQLLSEVGLSVAEDSLRVAWGRAASPLVDSGRVIVPLGGTPRDGGDSEDSRPCYSLIAYDLNGQTLWKQGKHQVSYASPQIAELDGLRQIIIVCEDFVSGHDASSGEWLWDFPWPGKSHANASCSQPIVVDHRRVFLSKGYTHGSALIQVVRDENGTWKAEQIWHERSSMRTKFSNPVLYQGHIYGLDDTILSCIQVETGRVLWRKRGDFGHGQVLRVGSHLLILAETGTVYQLRMDPEKCQLVGRLNAIEGKTWNSICLSGQLLLVRNGEQAACFRLPVVER